MAEITYGQIVNGMKSSCKGTASEGKAYILKQFKIPKSAYRMPTETSSETEWEQWFDKVSDIPNQFDIDPATVIFTFTGHLAATHRPTYGWREAALALQHAGTAITLSAFFAHIRKQLFVSRGTRKAAYEELLQVHSEITNFPDCFAFSTYLKTLWPKLFPAESEERAPIQQYEACLLLHRIMSGIFELNRQIRKSNAFVHAWCKVQYNDIEIHQKYLTESAHQIAGESEKLCAKYLEFIHTQLRNAQESYNAVQGVAVATHSQSVNALSSFPFDREATFRADQSHAPTKRKHENNRNKNDAHANKRRPSGGKNGGGGAGGGAGGSAGQRAPNAGPSHSNHFNAMSDKGEERERNTYPEGLQIHQLARLIPGRADTTLNDAIALCKKGKCVMCGASNHAKGPKSCPSANSTDAIHAQVSSLLADRTKFKYGRNSK
jgi:hypothetical protein